MPAPYATHRRQLELILRAWGMDEPTASDTAEIMSWADLHGIDTHGISMIPPYDERRRTGKAEPSVAVDRDARHACVGAGRRQRRARSSGGAARHEHRHRQ